jgi:hypothetical protein
MAGAVRSTVEALQANAWWPHERKEVLVRRMIKRVAAAS